MYIYSSRVDDSVKALRAVNRFHILVASGNFMYTYIAICVADLVKALKAAYAWHIHIALAKLFVYIILE